LTFNHGIMSKQRSHVVHIVTQRSGHLQCFIDYQTAVAYSIPVSTAHLPAYICRLSAPLCVARCPGIPARHKPLCTVYSAYGSLWWRVYMVNSVICAWLSLSRREVNVKSNQIY